LDLVRENEILRSVDLKAYPNAVLLGTHQRERVGLFDQLAEAFDASLALAARDKVPQPPNDLAGAQGLLGRLGDGAADGFRILVGAAVQKPLGPLEIVGDRDSG
jgi:hypothetical protein